MLLFAMISISVLELNVVIVQNVALVESSSLILLLRGLLKIQMLVPVVFSRYTIT